MPTTTFFSLKESKRQLILDLAIEEFAANDYERASISRLVARAGIAKGSIYQYFSGKRDLYFYLLDLAAAEKHAFFQANPADPGDDIYARLRHMFRAGLAFEFSNPDLAQIAYRAVYGGGPPGDDAIEHLRRSSAAFFQEMVREAMNRGEIDPTLEPHLVAFLLNQLLSGFGDFLLERMGLEPGVLAGGGASKMDTPQYWQDIDQLLLILQRGLQPAVR